MQYPAREDNPVSAVSLEHSSWEQERAPDPCSLDSWLRSALPEAAPPAASSSERDSYIMQQVRVHVCAFVVCGVWVLLVCVGGGETARDRARDSLAGTGKERAGRRRGSGGGVGGAGVEVQRAG